MPEEDLENQPGAHWSIALDHKTDTKTNRNWGRAEMFSKRRTRFPRGCGGIGRRTDGIQPSKSDGRAKRHLLVTDSVTVDIFLKGREGMAVREFEVAPCISFLDL